MMFAPGIAPAAPMDAGPIADEIQTISATLLSIAPTAAAAPQLGET